jgi:hypothetical protein
MMQAMMMARVTEQKRKTTLCTDFEQVILYEAGLSVVRFGR